MKMIEIIKQDVKKCYKTPTIRFVRVEEECILAGSLDGDVPHPETEQSSDPKPGGGRSNAKQFTFGIIDDETDNY